MTRQAPGSRASVLISDDSDAPPANSLMDGIVSTPESKSHFRVSVFPSLVRLEVFHITIYTELSNRRVGTLFY